MEENNNNEQIPFMTRYIRDLELKKMQQWKEEGKTKEEILQMMDQKRMTKEDVDELFRDEENSKTENNDAKVYLNLKDEDLIDYENQPFSTDNEKDNQVLMDSIKLNGIIEPIVVRPYKGKYQILSGHRRRLCGRKVGLTEFPCCIKEKNDDEAAIFLVDTNLVTRENIKPTERAKAYELKRKALKELKKENKDLGNEENARINIRENLTKETLASDANIQRYLRINYLIKELQDAVDNKKINLKTAEQLSFLNQREQNMMASLIYDENKKINERQAKEFKEISKTQDITKEILDKVLKPKNKFKEIIIKFTEEECEIYFDGNRDAEELKEIFVNTILNSKTS